MNRGSEITASSGKAIRVLIVDDHPIVLAGLRALIDASPGTMLVGAAESAAEALACAVNPPPDVVVTDLRLTKGNGFEVTRAVLEAWPQTRVLVLTTYIGDETIHASIDAGAIGFVSKAFAESELIAAITAVSQGRRYFSADVTRRLMEDGPRVLLTARERSVLLGMSEGLRNKQIGARLGVTEATARTHVERILAKFNCRDRGRAVALAHQRGFFDVDPSTLRADDA